MQMYAFAVNIRVAQQHIKTEHRHFLLISLLHLQTLHTPLGTRVRTVLLECARKSICRHLLNAAYAVQKELLHQIAEQKCSVRFLHNCRQQKQCTNHSRPHTANIDSAVHVSRALYFTNI